MVEQPLFAPDASPITCHTAIGAYNAVLWRTGAGTILSGAIYFASRPAMPDAKTLRIHAVRSLFVAGMAVSFFWALARLPMAEAIAIAFIAPLVTLYMAAVFLGERIGPRSIIASLLGIVGVIVIVAGKLGRGDYAPEALWAVAAVFASALLYAYNLILARQQAIQGVDQVVIRSRAQLHDHDTARGMGHEDRQQPVVLVRHEPGAQGGQVREPALTAGPDRDLLGPHDGPTGTAP